MRIYYLGFKKIKLDFENQYLAGFGSVPEV
jgi:hypothetical protein